MARIETANVQARPQESDGQIPVATAYRLITLDDVTLSPFARLVMWAQRTRLDVIEFRPAKALSFALAVGIEKTTDGQMLTRLVEASYLDEPPQQRPRESRAPLGSRRRLRGVPE